MEVITKVTYFRFFADGSVAIMQGYSDEYVVTIEDARRVLASFGTIEGVVVCDGCSYQFDEHGFVKVRAVEGLLRDVPGGGDSALSLRGARLERATARRARAGADKRSIRFSKS